MPIRISGVSLPLDEPETALPERISRILGLPLPDVSQWRILRKSLDARSKSALRFVYSVEVTFPEGEDLITAKARASSSNGATIESHVEPPFTMPAPGSQRLPHRPIVIGSGPAGLAAGYFLAAHGYRPLLFERGRKVRDRIHDVRAFDTGGALDPESNYLFGEGGAGTFSDGKLTCRNSGPDVRRILELFAECKGKPSILYDYRPHLGSNRLPAVVKALRQRIENLGGEFHFSCRVEDMDIEDGKLRGLTTSSGPFSTSVAVLAIGHSARDTYEMLRRRGVPMEQKPFQMGVRIEHPQENVNRVQYGPNHWETQLGAADYTLVVRGAHDLFTFCMCAGGHIIPSVAEAGYFCTNGMSLSNRDSPFANSGLMITVHPDMFGSTDVFAGIRLQQEYERKAFHVGRGDYLCPLQSAADFLAERQTHRQPPCSYERGVVLSSLAELVPPPIRNALHKSLPILDRRWHGRFLADATMVGPESRGSSPIRMLRDPTTLESTGIVGLYPIGEGAGFAGGIVSAAVDGLRAARAIIERYAPLDRKNTHA